MLFFGVRYQNWREKTTVTDEDFEQTNANRREYAMHKSFRAKNNIPIYGSYAGSCFCAIAGIFTFGGTYFSFYISSAIMLYWLVFVFSTIFKTEETLLIDRLNKRGDSQSPRNTWRKWLVFVRRRILFGLLYTILLLLVWRFKL